MSGLFSCLERSSSGKGKKGKTKKRGKKEGKKEKKKKPKKNVKSKDSEIEDSDTDEEDESESDDGSDEKVCVCVHFLLNMQLSGKIVPRNSVQVYRVLTDQGKFQNFFQ